MGGLGNSILDGAWVSGGYATMAKGEDGGETWPGRHAPRDMIWRYDEPVANGGAGSGSTLGVGVQRRVQSWMREHW